MAGAVTFIRTLAILVSGMSLPFFYRRMPLQQVALTFQHWHFILSLLFLILTLLIYDKPLWLMIVAMICSAIIGFVSGCATSASSAMYPRIVPQAQWVRSNNLINTGSQMVSLLGWSIGGILIAQLGQIHVLYLCVVLLLTSSLLQSRIRPQTIEHAASSNSNKENKWWSSYSTLFKNPRVRIITIMDIIEGIAGGIWIGAVTLVFVKEVLHQTEAWWGYINAAFYIGTLLGGMLLLPLSKKMERNLLRSIIIGSFCFGLLVLLYAWNAHPYVALALVLVMGPFYQLRDISQRTYLQQLVPLSEQPALFAAQQSLSTILFGLSILFSAGVADMWGAQMVYILGGLMCLLSSILGIGLKVQASRISIDESPPFS